MNPTIVQSTTQLAQLLSKRQLQLALAESCTAGGVAYAITEMPGSSAWFDRGFVCYSNAAKIDLLGVNAQTLTQFGAVSQETALEMVQGALNHSLADIAIAVTGIAGPGGGSDEKPVGTVFIAVQQKHQSGQCQRYLFSGDRAAIREQVIAACLQAAIEGLTNDNWAV